VCEREREHEKERMRERERWACVYACAYLRECLRMSTSKFSYCDC